MTVKIFRRGSAKCFGLLSAFITILLCLYYISIGQSSQTRVHRKDSHPRGSLALKSNNTWNKIYNSNANNKSLNKKIFDNEIEFSDDGNSYKWDECIALQDAKADIDTISEFSKFEFEVTSALFEILKYTY
jgi:hypothetical protein